MKSANKFDEKLYLDTDSDVKEEIDAGTFEGAVFDQYTLFAGPAGIKLA